jgi:hypothetical protein
MKSSNWPPAVGTWHRYTLDRAQLRRSSIPESYVGMECRITKHPDHVQWVQTNHGWACNADDLILYPLQESET